MRADAAPQQEGFGGLLDQHAEAIKGVFNAVRVEPADEGGVAGGVVGEVVSPGGARRVGQRRHFAGEAGRSCVDDAVETAPAEFVERYYYDISPEL